MKSIGHPLFKLSIITLIFLFSSCDYFFPPLSGDRIPVKEAYNFLRKHSDDKDIVILDVRSKKEYDEFHLRSSILLDYKETSFPAEIEKLDRSKRYLIFSRGSTESFNTLELMMELKFSRVHAVTGGIDEWKKENLPDTF
ncbi:MAG: rhodanese-like domain-containing protein [Ignavibacteria bacterium]